MFAETTQKRAINQRVRAILLTAAGAVLLIKRVKPNRSAPYWVAPGGGRDRDESLLSALERELFEELGAVAGDFARGFVLEHEKAGKRLEEHFFICRLQGYDLSKRNGPEFEDPARGEYIPEEIPLEADALWRINIKTPELRAWMLEHLEELKAAARHQPAPSP